MEISNRYIATPESYVGANGLVSILNQNILEGIKSGFPVLYRININWSDEDISSAITELPDYDITYHQEGNYWEINYK
jgi:hypothetical protein